MFVYYQSRRHDKHRLSNYHRGTFIYIFRLPECLYIMVIKIINMHSRRFQLGPPPPSIIINHLTQTSISCSVWFNNNDNNNNRYIRMQIYIMYIVYCIIYMNYYKI